MKVRSYILSPFAARGIAVICAAVLLGGTSQIARAAGVVGTGTAASCTDTALNAALAGGGLVTFNCGPDPVAIDISIGTGTKTIAADTIIDGGGLITISGGNTVGVFVVNSGVNFAVDNLTLANGALSGFGGGIYNNGTLTVTKSTFTGNGNGALSEGFGGGIYNNGTLTVTNSTFTGNSADIGGGIYNNEGRLNVTNSTFTGNKATGASQAGVQGAGGGIFSFGEGLLTVANSTFIGNSPNGIGNGTGGESPVAGGVLTVTNCTFAGNTGVGITHQGYPLGHAAVIRNTILNCDFSITDGGHNLDSGTSCGFSTANGSLSNTDPQLDPAGLQNNGGPTQTLALCTAVGEPAGCTAASPAIDAGDQAVCAAAPVNDRDQRGFVRPGTGHTNCSIGAYEADAIPAPPCVGDCDGNGGVAINELVTLVNIALGNSAACPKGVPAGATLDIALLIRAVNSALVGCPACGNGRVDGDETCDDGNTVGGDGCAANCTPEDRRPYTIGGVTCVGGPNDGASCHTKDDCPGGIGPSPCASTTVQGDVVTIPLLLSGQEILTTGRARASDPDGTLPVVIKAADVHFDPVRLPGLECVCVRAVAVDAFGPGIAGGGEIGCGPAGLLDIDVTSSRDHDISDVDPTCATGTRDPQSNACIGPLNITRSGGQGPRGSAVIRLSVGVEDIPDGGTCATETQTTVCQGGSNPGARCFGGCDGECVPAKGPDGIPCTKDDPPVATIATLYLTTGTARAEVLDANGTPGERIGVGEQCSNGPCHAESRGAPFNCDALAADPGGGVDGASLVSAFPIINSVCLGDTVTTGVTPLLGLPKLSCGGGR